MNEPIVKALKECEEALDGLLENTYLGGNNQALNAAFHRGKRAVNTAANLLAELDARTAGIRAMRNAFEFLANLPELPTAVALRAELQAALEKAGEL